MKERLIKQLAKVETLAAASKLTRLLHHPYRYISSIFFRQFIYPRHKKEQLHETTLFFGKKMQIALPASTDIYLTGGKSHNSEIRLAKFIILNLENGRHFLDIGAHYGYFTLIAAELVGDTGKIMAFEPTTKTFDILNHNCSAAQNIQVFQKAVSDKPGTLSFFEFPNKYSEYNSIHVEQFSNEAWFKESQPRKVEVATTTIDEITRDKTFQPRIIKIDVEGAEYSVMLGAAGFLQYSNPYIVLEYLEPGRHNEEHRKAAAFLRELAFRSYVISAEGQLEAVEDIDAYLTTNHLDSDNIVFKKS